jgi:hypothetical protein
MKKEFDVISRSFFLEHLFVYLKKMLYFCIL